MSSEQQFGRYTLCERIGLGGMAEIFRATTAGPGGFEMEVCIKRILPHCCADQDFVGMFIDEARLAARLRHANIVQILDFNVVDERYYIAMELIEGKDLRSLLTAQREQGQPLGAARAAFVAAEMCRGLGYAHTRHERGQPMRIVHRDVSPHNVLLSFAGEVKISDFGIAKAASRLTSTATGTVKGKIAYMSPEQAASLDVDHRSDQFSTGLVLFEMLSGRRAYEGDSQVTILQAALRGVVPPLQAVLPDVPAALVDIVARATATDREQRFASMDEMERDLRRFLYEVQPAPEDLDLGVLVRRHFGASRVDRPRTELLPAVAELPPFEDAPEGPGDSVWADGPAQAAQRTATSSPAVAALVQPTVTSAVAPLDERAFARAITPVASPSIETAAVQSLARAQAQAASLRGRRAALVAAGGLAVLALAISLGLVLQGGSPVAGDGAGLDARVLVAAAGAQVQAPAPGLALDAATAADVATGPDLAPAPVDVDTAPPARPDESFGSELDVAVGGQVPQVRPASARGRGKVMVYLSDGWAEVWVGSSKMGTTPVEFELPVGRRTLRLYNPELRREQRVTVKIDPNQTTRVLRSLQDLR